MQIFFRIDRNGHHDTTRLLMILLAVSGFGFHYQFVFARSLNEGDIRIRKKDVSNNLSPSTENENKHDFSSNTPKNSFLNKLRSTAHHMNYGNRNERESSKQHKDLRFDKSRQLKKDNFVEVLQSSETDKSLKIRSVDRPYFLDDDNVESKDVSKSEVPKSSNENSEKAAFLELHPFGSNVPSSNNVLQEEPYKADVDFVLKDKYLEPENAKSQEDLKDKNLYLGLGYQNYIRKTGFHGPNGMAQDQQMFLAQFNPVNLPSSGVANNQQGNMNDQNEGISTDDLIDLIKEKTGGMLDSNLIIELANEIIEKKQDLNQEPQHDVNEISEAAGTNQPEGMHLEINDVPPINSNEEIHMKESMENSGNVDDLDAVLHINTVGNDYVDNAANSEIRTDSILGEALTFTQNKGKILDFQNDKIDLQPDVVSAELDHLFGVGPSRLSSGGDAYGMEKVINAEMSAVQADVGGEEKLDALFSDQQNNIKSLENYNQAEESQKNTFEGGGDLDEIFRSNEIQPSNRLDEVADGDAELDNIFGGSSNNVVAPANNNLFEVSLDKSVEGRNELYDIIENNADGSLGEFFQSQRNMIDRNNKEGLKNELDDIFEDTPNVIEPTGNDNLAEVLLDNNIAAGSELDNIFGDNEIESPGETSQMKGNIIDKVNGNVLIKEDKHSPNNMVNDNDSGLKSIFSDRNEVSHIMLDRVKENIGNYKSDPDLDALFNENNLISRSQSQNDMSPPMVDRIQESSINNEGIQDLDSMFNDNIDLGKVKINEAKEARFFDDVSEVQSPDGIPQNQNEVAPDMIDRAKENVIDFESDKELDAIFGNDNINPSGNFQEDRAHYLGLGYLNYRVGFDLHGPNGMAQDQQMFLGETSPVKQSGSSISNNQPGNLNNQNGGISTEALINLIKEKVGGNLDSNSVLELAQKIIAQKQGLVQQSQQNVNKVSEISGTNQVNGLNSEVNYGSSINTIKEIHTESVYGNNVETAANPEIGSNSMLDGTLQTNQNIKGTLDFQNDNVDLQPNVMSNELDHLFGVGPSTLNSGGDTDSIGQVISGNNNMAEPNGFGGEEIGARISDQQNNIYSLENPSQVEESHEKTFEGGGELDEIFGNKEMQPSNQLDKVTDGDAELGNIFGDAPNVVESPGNDNLAEILLDNSVGESNELDDLFGNVKIGSLGVAEQAQSIMTDVDNGNAVDNELDSIFGDSPNVIQSQGNDNLAEILLDNSLGGGNELDDIFGNNGIGSPVESSQVQGTVGENFNENTVDNDGLHASDSAVNGNDLSLNILSPGENKVPQLMLDRVKENIENYKGDPDLDAIFNNNMDLGEVKINEVQSSGGILQSQNGMSPNMVDRVKENIMDIQPDLELDAIFGNDNINPPDYAQDSALTQLLNGFEKEDVPEDSQLNHELHDLFNSDYKNKQEEILDPDTFVQEYIGNDMNHEMNNVFSSNNQKEKSPSVNLNGDLETLEGDFFNSLDFDYNGMMGGPNPANPDEDSSSRDLSLGRDLLGLSLNRKSSASEATNSITEVNSDTETPLINHEDIDDLIFGSNTGRTAMSENAAVKGYEDSQHLASSEGNGGKGMLSNLQKLLLDGSGESQDSAVNDLDAILNSGTKLNDNTLRQQADSQNLEELLLSDQANSEDTALSELENLISGGSKETASGTSSSGSAVSQDLEKLLFGDQQSQDSALDELERLMNDNTKQNQGSNLATNMESSGSQQASQDLEKLLFGDPEGQDTALSELDKLMSGGQKPDLSGSSPSINSQPQQAQDLQSLLFGEQTEDSALSELDKAMGSAPQKSSNPSTQSQVSQDLEALLFGDQDKEGDSALLDLDKAMGTPVQRSPPSPPAQNQQSQDLQSLLFQDPGKDTALDELDNLVSLGNPKTAQPSGSQPEGQNLESILFGSAGNDAALDDLGSIFSGNSDSKPANAVSGHTNSISNPSLFSKAAKPTRNLSPASETERSSSGLPSLYEAYSEGGIKSSLKIGEKEFLLNEKPIRIISGSIHYFRVHPSYWRDRLQKLRAAGFNTVETMVPWALHEPSPKQVIFKSFFVDLRKFITTAKEEDLFVILRPGPYVSAEFDFGGMPSWLLENSFAKLRTPHPSFYLPAKQYLIRLSKLVIDMIWSTLNGAQPVIMVQIENDYTIYGASLIRDQKYIEGLKRVMVEAGLKDVMFSTCNAPRDITKSRIISGLTQTVSYSGDPTYPLHVMKTVTPNTPAFFMEYRTGIVDVWGEPHHKKENLTDFQRNFEYILSNGSSVNLYMFHGGTTQGFYTGGTSQHFDGFPKPIVSSYDYDAPLTESGDYTSKYWALRKLTQKYKFGPEVRLPSVPPTPKKTTFRATPIKQYLTCFDLVSTLEKKYTKDSPIFVEDIAPDIGGNIGYILYRVTGVKLVSISLMKILADIHDAFYVMVDGKYVEPETKPPDSSAMFSQLKEYQYALEGDDKSDHIIDILVENLGRGYRRVFHDQHKGMKGSVNIDGVQLTNWQIFPMDFSSQWIQSLKSWKDLNEALGPKPGPTFYRTSLMVLRTQIADTFVDFSVENNPWTKGVVFVNGYNLGRYWNIGPSRTLYLPAALLKPGLNEFFIFEVQQPGETIYFEIEPKISAS